VSAETAGLEQTIEWLTTFPDDLLGKIKHAGEIVDLVLNAISPIWRGLVEDVEKRARELWAQIVKYANQVYVWFKEELLPGILAPITLWNASQSWTTDVSSKVTDVQGRFQRSRMTVDDYWHGPAAVAYVQAIDGQKDAAQAVYGSVEKMRSTLQELSIGIGAAYIALVAAGGLATIEIEGGTATLFGVITIPVGLAAILTGLLTLVAGLGAATAAWAVVTNNALASLGSLRAAFNDDQALDHGHWPRATTNLADGSMSDGNRSLWTYYADQPNAPR
jgi:hypothetical protein